MKAVSRSICALTAHCATHAKERISQRFRAPSVFGLGVGTSNVWQAKAVLAKFNFVA